MRGGSGSAMICSVAASPSNSGILMSISTTSTWRLLQASMIALPFATEATTVMSGSLSMMSSKPARIMSRSSAMATLIMVSPELSVKR